MPTIPLHNVHSRLIAADVDTVGKVIDTLAGPEDLLWPVHDWMPMHLERPIAIGATGGHGPARYRVVGYQPGRWLRFELYQPTFLHGFHEFSARPSGPDATLLVHMTLLRVAPEAWPFYLLFKSLHNDVIEAALDRAERASTGRLDDPVEIGRLTRLAKTLMPMYLKWFAGRFTTTHGGTNDGQ